MMRLFGGLGVTSVATRVICRILKHKPFADPVNADAGDLEIQAVEEVLTFVPGDSEPPPTRLRCGVGGRAAASSSSAPAGDLADRPLRGRTEAAPRSRRRDLRDSVRLAILDVEASAEDREESLNTSRTEAPTVSWVGLARPTPLGHGATDSAVQGGSEWAIRSHHDESDFASVRLGSSPTGRRERTRGPSDRSASN